MSHLSRMVQDFAPWVLPEISKYLRAFDIAIENVPLKSLTLLSAADMNAHLIGELDEFLSREEIDAETRETAESVRERLRASAALCREMATKLEKIAANSEALAKEMDFSFLYDKRKQLLTIGYDAERECLPDYHYDLFASEARTGVFAAVAKGEIPQETWLRLRRPYAAYGNTPVVLSWTGTMFEYLLPKLWMKSYSNTMLERSSRGALRAQQKFTKGARVPWGISESSCLDKNPDGFYRYHAFGVPGLSLNAANSRELVISPYSSFLGLLVDEASASKNLKQMEQMGCVGPLGYYEAIDFTPSRLGEGKKFEIVKCWMAHHQGMNMLALANVLLGAPMQRRFHAEPLVQATERLLHEKFPRMSKLEKAEKAQVTARQILRAQQGRPAGAKLLFAWIHRARKDEAEKGALAGNLAAEHHRSDS
jgi:cyclic beta-1,2-glucan glucanotransferase